MPSNQMDDSRHVNSLHIMRLPSWFERTTLPPPESLLDLARVKRLVLGAPESPIGQYTDKVLNRLAKLNGPDARMAISDIVVSREKNVRLARSKVTLGAADAAIVYITDGHSAPELKVIPIPPHLNASATYEMGLIGQPSAAARAWLAFLNSETARTILKSHRFTVK